MAKFFRQYLSWQKLVPDVVQGGTPIANPFVTNGRGTYSKAGNWLPNNFVTSGASPDRTLAIAYVPGTNGSGAIATGIPVTINSAVVGGTQATVQWYDPTKDPALGSSYTALCSPRITACQAGNQTFTTPSALHSDGYADWVLVATGP
jgi:hypothetical protein